MQKTRIALVITIFVLMLSHQAASAASSWYAGNTRSSTYGVKATIRTPSSAPSVQGSGESNWVSTPCCNWVQTGWRFREGYSNAKPYVEHCISGNCGAAEYGTQSWNTNKNYKVDYGGSSTWYAYIDDNNKGGWGPITAPQTAQALSEVHDYSSNELSTHFFSVQYRTSGGSWQNFDQDNFIEDPPYYVQQDAYYAYKTYGPWP